MSAPVLHLLAFSAPAVNAGEVSFRANFGTHSVILAATPTLMSNLGRALTAASGASGAEPVKLEQRLAGRQGPSVAPERLKLYQEILAIAESDPSYGAIVTACRARGISHTAFTNWRKRAKKRAAAA